MLHITNGVGAAQGIREATLRGDILCWNDVLHEGPVPAGLDDVRLRDLRARFIAACGWGALHRVRADLERRDARLAAAQEEDEVVLWFEHDLYDQLQLVQVLSRLAAPARRPARVSLVATNQYLGTRAAAWFGAEYGQREPVSDRMWAEAVQVWEAFGAEEPTRLTELRPRCVELSFLAAAVGRHLQEFPSLQTGLSRFEEQLLHALARGPLEIVDAYHAAHHDREDAVFMGDVVFAWHLDRLSRGPGALVALAGGGVVALPAGVTSAYWEQQIELTRLARRVLAGDVDRVPAAGIDRWLGGVHLEGHQVRWRWDERNNRIVDMARVAR